MLDRQREVLKAIQQNAVTKIDRICNENWKPTEISTPSCSKPTYDISKSMN